MRSSPAESYSVIQGGCDQSVWPGLSSRCTHPFHRICAKCFGENTQTPRTAIGIQVALQHQSREPVLTAQKSCIALDSVAGVKAMTNPPGSHVRAGEERRLQSDLQFLLQLLDSAKV